MDYNPTLEMSIFGDKDWASFLLFLLFSFFVLWWMINGLIKKRPGNHYLEKRARARRKARKLAVALAATRDGKSASLFTLRRKARA